MKQAPLRIVAWPTDSRVYPQCFFPQKNDVVHPKKMISSKSTPAFCPRLI
jgi:hypothetical protein